MNNSYILQSGEKGAERLATVQNLYGKESQFFLQKSGLKKGMTVIDIGCGTGLMTKWLAEQVGKTGHVIAIDNSENQLELAKKYLSKHNIKNVTYYCKDILDLTHNDLHQVNLLYCRLVLVHHRTPFPSIKHLVDQCKIKTIFVFEEPITSESECIPYSDEFQKHIDLYCNLALRNDLDFNFGNQILPLINQSSLTVERLRKVKRFYSSYSEKLIAYQRTKECAEQYLSHDLIKNHELNALLERLMALAKNPTTWISGVNMIQVNAKKT